MQGLVLHFFLLVWLSVRMRAEDGGMLTGSRHHRCILPSCGILHLMVTRYKEYDRNRCVVTTSIAQQLLFLHRIRLSYRGFLQTTEVQHVFLREIAICPRGISNSLVPCLDNPASRWQTHPAVRSQHHEVLFVVGRLRGLPRVRTDARRELDKLAGLPSLGKLFPSCANA